VQADKPRGGASARILDFHQPCTGMLGAPIPAWVLRRPTLAHGPPPLCLVRLSNESHGDGQVGSTARHVAVDQGPAPNDRHVREPTGRVQVRPMDKVS